MAFVSAIFLLSFLLCVIVEAQHNHSNKISLGSSLYPTTHPTSWLSSTGLFAFGFFSQGNGFLIGIWLMGKGNNKQVLWTANRDDPPITSNATLELTMDGKLILKTEQGEEKLLVNATVSASSASMLDSGNFVLYNKYSQVLWESFDHPTDTIVGGQKLSSGSGLFSSSSDTDYSTGRFHLKIREDDGNLCLYPANTGEAPSDSYWSTIYYFEGSNVNLYLNYTGTLALVDSNDMNMIFEPSVSANNKKKVIYRATLDIDGVFRLYSHTYNGNSEPITSIESAIPNNPCEVKSFCGFNSFCTLNDNQPVCLCLPGTDFVDPSQWSLGCDRNFSQEGCRGGKENMAYYNMTSMENMNWGDRPYFSSRGSMSKENCSKSCLEDCHCGAALFKDGNCMKQELPLRYVTIDASKFSTAFLKVGTRSIKIGRNETTNPPVMKPPVIKIMSKKAVTVILIVTVSLFTSSCAALAISGFFIYKFRVVRYKRLLEHGKLGITEELILRSFSYNELRRATNGFKQVLGKGSFGTVYKGALHKGKKLIAVKRLEKMVEEGEREFRAEMRAIGRTHHRNLVRLLGYCADDSKRLLVYEYMSNGSLADLLFRAKTRPDWNERLRIALDVARGILYLHEECDAPIIHCDIKPKNILMDDFWTAKIADFGLAKLLMPDQTRTFTGARGTRGYSAPEWQRSTPITVKADIYSYGIALLEIVFCRKNFEVNVSEPEAIVLSYWVYKCFVARELNKLVDGEEVDMETLEKMVKVGFWCIQDEPALRPSMKSVVLMLEGITDVAIPPCPTGSSV